MKTFVVSNIIAEKEFHISGDILSFLECPSLPSASPLGPSKATLIERISAEISAVEANRAEMKTNAVREKIWLEKIFLKSYG